MRIALLALALFALTAGAANVPDNGIEALRKSAEYGPVVPYEFRLRVVEANAPDILSELEAFHAENHADNLIIHQLLNDIDDHIEDFKSEAHDDSVAIQGKLDQANSYLSNIDSLGAKDATLAGFQGEAHADSTDEQGFLNLITIATQSLDTDFDVALSTRASESTLSSFQSANHTDLLGVQTRQDSTNTKLDTVNSNLVTVQGKQDIGNTRLGDLTETAPASDTASSGLNGRLQRIAQRLTSLIAFYSSDFGSSTGAIRTASQVGNASGAADFNSGATSAQTIRTASNLYDSAGNALTSRSYDSTRPLDVYVTQMGANNITFTRVTPTANVSTQLVAANSARKWLYVENESGATFFMRMGGTAVINQSIALSDKEIFQMNTTNLYLGAINVIVGSNGRTIEVTEGF